MQEISKELAIGLLKNPIFLVLFIIGIGGTIIMTHRKIKKLHKKHKKTY